MAVPRDRFLTPDRVREVFGLALRRAPGERARFLDEACAGDPALRAEVDSLLAAGASMGDFLAEPATRLLDEPPFDPGTEIAGFRVERVLGSGSGGTVYEAWQRRPRRRVALKLMRAGLGSAAARRRFETEAEILARLSHPAVAHVYAAGVHDGRPWFAMEYVDGARDVLAHARAARLDRRARLALVASICDAVHHGHQQGVIHRDLKPGNVLTDAHGRLKIIDFGIARVAGREPGPALAGTLPYAAPEQCTPRGRVDVRSDVYSLGVLLYEMLAGRPPYDVDDLPATEALAAIRARAPRPLRAGDRDVRAIVGKAMARDPDGRYASAAALADDLRRRLSHGPVAARGGGALYQLGRYARRHRLASVALAAVFGITATAAVLNARARAEAEWQAYVANIAAASAALRVDDVAEARQRLAATPEQLRDWEWRYLFGRLDQADKTLAWPGMVLWTGAVSPDGRLVAAAGQPRDRLTASVRIWERGAVRATLHAETRPDALAFDPAGKRIAIGYTDGSVEMRTAPAGQMLWRRAAHAATVIALAFDPAGGRLASTSRDATIRLWDLAAGTPGRVLRGHGDRVICAVFGAGGERLYSGARDGEIRVWDVATGAVRATLRGHAASVEGVAVDPAGARLASASRDLTVRLWDLATGRLLATRRSHGANVRAIVYGGGVFVSGSWDSTLRIWNPRDGGELGQLRGHTGEVVALGAAGGEIVSFGREGEVRFWSTRRPAEVLEEHEDLVSAVAFGHDGRVLASASFDGTVRLWDPRTSAPRRRIDAGGRVFDMAIDAAGRVFAVVEKGSTVVWSAGGTRVAALGSSSCVATGGERTALARSREIRTWTGDAWDAPLRIPAAGVVTALAVADDGHAVASGNRDGVVVRWSAAAGRAEERVHEGAVHGLAFGGPILASCGDDGLVRLLDRASLAVRATLAGHTAPVRAVAFLPDGTRLASAGADGTVRLWDVATRRQVAVLHGHRFPVWDVAVSPDGSTIATCDGSVEDRLSAVRLWITR